MNYQFHTGRRRRMTTFFKILVVLVVAVYFCGCLVLSLVATSTVHHDQSIRTTEWSELSEKCIDFQPELNRHRINPQCISDLDQIFFEEPIWKYYNPPVYGNRGGWYSHSSRLVPIRKVLPFTVEDFYGETVPTWTQIFAGKYYERKNKVAESLMTPECTNTKDYWGKEPNLSQQCYARELATFAISLDVCTTVRDLYLYLHSREFDGDLSLYEWGLKALRTVKNLVDAGQPVILPPIDESSYLKNYVWVHWTLDKCNELSGAYLGFDYDHLRIEHTESANLEDLKPKSNLSVSDLIDLVKPQYELAMQTAARLGDGWAIRMSIPPSPSDDQSFWKMLEDNFPSLYYQYMSSDYLKINLSLEDKLANAYAAFELFNTKHKESLTASDDKSEDLTTENFSDYLRLNQRVFKGIIEQYSRNLLNSIKSVEEARITKSDRDEIFRNRSLEDLPPGSKVIEFETHFP